MYARAQRIALAFTAVGLLLAVSPWIPAAQAQEQDCSQALTDMDEQYIIGRFDTVIDTLTQCLDEDSYDAEQRRQAYRLLSLSYLGKELVEDARGSVRKLLEAVPNYQPDPVQDPPLFIEMVQEEREQLAAADEEEPTEEAPADQEPTEEEPADAVADDEAEQEPPPELVRRPEDDRDEPPPPPIQRRPQEEGGSNLTRWLLIGGGVVAAGVVAAVLAGGGGGGNGGGGGGGGGTPLPGPPALPGGN